MAFRRQKDFGVVDRDRAEIGLDLTFANYVMVLIW